MGHKRTSAGLERKKTLLNGSVAASFLVLLFFPFIQAHAQQVEMSSTLNPVGSGARAIGMGGAFISVADDATAASWNPAGLVQLEKPEISAAYQFFSRSQDYNSDAHPEVNTSNSMSANGLNYASAAYPFVLFDRNIVVSVNYQRLYDMNKDVTFKYTWNLDGLILNDKVRFEQDGYLYALSPAIAVQVAPWFYLGMTVNFWGDYVGDNGWHNTNRAKGQGSIAGFTFLDDITVKKDIAFKGVNANFGFLLRFWDNFTLGGVVKTPFDARLSQKTSYSETQEYPDFNEVSTFEEDTYEKLTMKMPASYGIGLSYRHSDALTFAIDIYKTEWSKHLIKDSDGNETNPLNGDSISQGRLGDTMQVRLGGEYLFIKENYVIPVRAGIFYDPSPAIESVDDYYGFSVGTGYSRGRFAFDIAYQFRFGNDVTGDIPETKMDVKQHTLMTSLIFYFQ